MILLEEPVWDDPRTTVRKPASNDSPLRLSLDTLTTLGRDVKWNVESDNTTAKVASFATLVSHLLAVPVEEAEAETPSLLNGLQDICAAKWEAFALSLEHCVQDVIEHRDRPSSLIAEVQPLLVVCDRAQLLLKEAIVNTQAPNTSSRAHGQDLDMTSLTLLKSESRLGLCRTALKDVLIGLKEEPDVAPPTQEQIGSHDAEAKRSLDRLAYLGGILLPLSIFAGIFSMAGDFGPGGSKFYVYWAVTLPLCVIILVIIYADTIRKLTGFEYLGEEQPEPIMETKLYMMSDSGPDQRTQELGWLRAFATIFGYRPK